MLCHSESLHFWKDEESRPFASLRVTKAMVRWVTDHECGADIITQFSAVR